MTTYESNRNDNYSQQHKSKLIELYGQYRGMRALLLTRVSTGSQSHEAQERVVRDLLIDLLDLKLDDGKHIIHSTYTGLEYRYHEALDEVLRMAERREFDVLCLDVLDRGLGRKGVSREVFRGQLRELGIHILTTEPSDHSDDDSLEGQLMRLLRGYKAEEEVNDFVRRTKNAKRDKALGNVEKGIPPKIIGNGMRPYGYKFVCDERGKKAALELNNDVVFVDRKGVRWTEVRVMLFMFRCAKRRISLRQICIRLNKIGIPSPCVSTKRKYVSRGVTAEDLIWSAPTLSRMIRNKIYVGKMIVNGQHTVKIPGMKSRRRTKSSVEDQIIVPVPSIVSPELQEDVIQNLQKNQKFSRRNNKQSALVLLYGGLAICGNCGRKARQSARKRKTKKGEKEYLYYLCTAYGNSLHKCSGCHIIAQEVDDEVWRIALEIIHNPSMVDKALEKQRSKDPTVSRRAKIKKDINALETERTNLQADLIRLIRERKLDKNTEDVLTRRLKEIDQLINLYNTDLLDNDKISREWEDVQKKLERLHKKCATMREKLENTTYEPDYKERRDIIEFFGITASIWEDGHTPRFKIQATFADIVVRLS